ncbi:hypothetical protein D1007_03905 [Hordeum vulgare]|nr:hypothetical protein D1007_03905 [Hordeum vulgare]
MAPAGKQKPEMQGPALAPPLLECYLSKDVDLTPVLPWTATDSTAESGNLLLKAGKKVENFTHHCVLMSIKDANPWLEEPKGLPEKTSAWSSAKPSDPRAEPILERFSHDISSKRLTSGMIVKEFLAQRLAPLQAHSRPLSDF